MSFAPSKLCPSKQIFYIHDFSDQYDMLLGREYLEANEAKVDYKVDYSLK